MWIVWCVVLNLRNGLSQFHEAETLRRTKKKEESTYHFDYFQVHIFKPMFILSHVFLCVTGQLILAKGGLIIHSCSKTTNNIITRFRVAFLSQFSNVLQELVNDHILFLFVSQQYTCITLGYDLLGMKMGVRHVLLNASSPGKHGILQKQLKHW